MTWCNQVRLSHRSSSRVDCHAHTEKGLEALVLGKAFPRSTQTLLPTQGIDSHPPGSCPAPGTACPQAQLGLAMPPASHRCLGLLARSTSWPLPASECCPVSPQCSTPTPLSESHKPHTDQGPWKQPCVSYEPQESSVPSPQHFLRQLPNTTVLLASPCCLSSGGALHGPLPQPSGWPHSRAACECDRAAVSVPPAAAEPTLLPSPAMLGPSGTASSPATAVHSKI